MMNPIDRLNDDCLQKIFDYIPIGQRLILEYVCPRWKRLIDYRNNHQTTLKIFRGKTELDSYNRNDHFFYQLKSCKYFHEINDFMIVGYLNYLSCQLLMTKFPNLKMLLISGCLFEPQDLMMLLRELKQLECFSLIICNMPSEDIFFNAMIKTINVCLTVDSLPSLKHFAISLAHNTLTNPFNIEFLFRIEELHLHNVALDYNHYFNTKTLNDRKLNLRKFSLFNQKRTFDFDERICQIFSKSVEQLTLVHETKISPKQKIELISNNFSKLTFLDIHFKYQLELHFLHSLNKLENLKEFRLRADDNCAIVKDESIDQPNAEAADVGDALDLHADVAVILQEEFSPVLTVESLHLDADFEPSVFDYLPKIFPSITRLTLNASRVCCTCPNIPDIIENDIGEGGGNNVAAQQARVDNADPNQQEAAPVAAASPPPPQLPPAPALVPNADAVDNIEFELDNCLGCFEHTIKIIGQWNMLKELSIVGQRCKDEALEPLKSMPQLQSLSLAACEEFSLKPFINICYQIAKKRPTNQSFIFKLNSTYFNKIIQLPNKPVNLFIFNVTPLTDLDAEMEKQKLKLKCPCQ